jgi:dihydroxy-acid dehydratase
VLDYRRTFQRWNFRIEYRTIFSPEAAAGGNIGKIVDGDIIEIDIPAGRLTCDWTEEELAARPMTPVTRDRYVPKSLKAYASMVSSADKGSSENYII